MKFLLSINVPVDAKSNVRLGINLLFMLGYSACIE